jgi:hypothetical protein
MMLRDTHVHILRGVVILSGFAALGFVLFGRDVLAIVLAVVIGSVWLFRSRCGISDPAAVARPHLGSFLVRRTITVTGRQSRGQRHPTKDVEPLGIPVGSQHFVASHRFLDDEEATGVIRDYEYRNRLIASIVRRGLSWLLGWEYRGSESDRRRLVRQLRLIAFRPRF